MKKILVTIACAIAVAAIGLLILNWNYIRMMGYVKDDFKDNGRRILQYAMPLGSNIDDKLVEKNHVSNDRETYKKGGKFLVLQGTVLAPAIHQIYACFITNYRYAIDDNNTLNFKIVNEAQEVLAEGFVESTSGSFKNLLRVWFDNPNIIEDQNYSIAVYTVVNGKDVYLTSFRMQ